MLLPDGYFATRHVDNENIKSIKSQTLDLTKAIKFFILGVAFEQLEPEVEEVLLPLFSVVGCIFHYLQLCSFVAYDFLFGGAFLFSLSGTSLDLDQ